MATESGECVCEWSAFCSWVCAGAWIQQLAREEA